MRRMLLAAAALLTVSTAALAATPNPALVEAVRNPLRAPKNVARDASRHPLEELTFFGVRPDSTVVEIWPGGGYWTQILAPYLFDHGTYYVAVPGGGEEAKDSAAVRAKFAAKPAYSHIKVTQLGMGHYDICPPGTADFVLTFRNVHNWMAEGDAAQVFAAFYKALKPGGVLGVEEHRARTDQPQDPKADNGYVREDYTIALAEKAGFKLAERSEMDANPRDTKDWPKGVWTLPPTFAMGNVDRAKYAAIGEADNFVLKFVKP